MSNLYRFIQELEIEKSHSDYVVKFIRARDLIHCLQAPSNVRRDLALVPDIDMKLYISLDGSQPEFIRDRIAASEARRIFGDDSLLGLCMSGRGASPEIFLNPVVMHKIDPSGALFDEITWHEYMHAGEGFIDSPEGIVREVPWSYRLQKLMLKIDAETDRHDTGLQEYPDEIRDYITYLREGTSLQENVSEIFARVGVLFYNNVRETGYALQPGDVVFFNPAGAEMSWDVKNRKTYNLTDLFQALATYSPDAQKVFWHFLPEAIKNVNILYGCPKLP